MDDDLLLRGRGKIHDVDAPAARPGTPGHDEWIIDEAIEETFPASDTPTPVRPGSLASERYGRAAARRHRRRATMRALMWCAAIGAVIAAVRALRGSHERPWDFVRRFRV
jgi:hypothetical protein